MAADIAEGAVMAVVVSEVEEVAGKTEVLR